MAWWGGKVARIQRGGCWEGWNTKAPGTVTCSGGIGFSSSGALSEHSGLQGYYTVVKAAPTLNLPRASGGGLSLHLAPVVVLPRYLP